MYLINDKYEGIRCQCGGKFYMVSGQAHDEDPDYECDECGQIARRDDYGRGLRMVENMRDNINGRPFKIVQEHEEGCKCEQCRHRGRADNGLTVHENALKEGRKRYGAKNAQERCSRCGATVTAGTGAHRGYDVYCDACCKAKGYETDTNGDKKS